MGSSLGAGVGVKLDEQVGSRIMAAIGKGEAVLGNQARGQTALRGKPTTSLNWQRYAEWRSQALACLTQVFGPAHTYTESFASQVGSRPQKSKVDLGVGILRAALEDVEQGHLQTVQQLATAEVFSDFIDQADHLLQKSYVMPAASLAGAVLENGLRSLAERNDIVVKAHDGLSALNDKLRAKDVYNPLRQQQVAYWVKVRNAADHGRFDDFKEADVAELIRGVRGFMADYL